MSVAAIVLAAGCGTRFATGPKMLAVHAGRPLVRLAAEAAVGGGAAPVLVVTGHRDAEVRAALDGLALQPLSNPDHADGLSTSLRVGFAALPQEAEAAIVLLGDMPSVTAQLVGELIAAWRRAGRPPALVPVHAGRRGNPVVLSRDLAPEIARLRGDAGAGPLLRNLSGVVEHQVADAAVTLDVDTAEALAALGADHASTTPSRMAE